MYFFKIDRSVWFQSVTDEPPVVWTYAPKATLMGGTCRVIPAEDAQRHRCWRSGSRRTSFGKELRPDVLRILLQEVCDAKSGFFMGYLLKWPCTIRAPRGRSPELVLPLAPGAFLSFLHPRASDGVTLQDRELGRRIDPRIKEYLG